MSAWHSLQGYLGYRPSGALSRFKAKKRQWFVLDEQHCQLLFYKTELDASAKKTPLGNIQLRAAAISLNMENPNQFLIHSQGKEHIFTAETHESTMIWLLALQAKRDAFHSKLTLFTDQGTAELKEKEGLKRKESLPSDQEIQQMIRRAMCAEDKGYCDEAGQSLYGLLRSQSVREHSHSSSSGSSCTSSLTHNFRKKVLHHSLRQSVDLGSIKSGGVDFSALCSRRTRTCSGGSVTTTDSEDADTYICHPLNLLSPIVSPRGLLEDCGHPLDEELTDTQKEPQPKTSCSQRALRLISADADEENGYSNQVTFSDKERIKELQDDLLLSKIELAKALCKEEDFIGVLQSKVAIIQHLEGQLRDSGDQRPQVDDALVVPSNQMTQRLEEKCRIIQNQNRFLNEEILKLSRMWQQEQMKFSQQNQKIDELETELDRLKRDYVFLLQSSVRIAGGDGPEFIEVPIYGGSRHKERVSKLLEEARRSNPSLPSLEGMAKSGCHVDAFGFKHCYINEGLMLHYLCGRLNQYYSEQLNGAEDAEKLWKQILKCSNGSTLPRTKEVKRLVRCGIPSHLRAKVWGILIQDKVSSIKENKGALYYNHLCSNISDSEVVNNHRRQISLDLFRTMPWNVHFNENEADGIQKMQEVLQAFCLHNPNVGYCQGMNFIVGMALLFVKPEDAFWFLVAVTERYFPPYYFDQNLMGAQADQEVLKDVLALKLMSLHRHLTTLDIELSTITLNWFLAVFFESVPFDTLLRIWDCFLYEGPKVLFRFSLAVFKMSESSLLECNNTIAMMRQLKASSKLCYDVEGLVRTAFEDLKPFPRRAEIVSKQACYLKTLKEKYRKRGEAKDALDCKEKLLDGIGLNSGDFSIECVAVHGDNLLICEGQQQEGRVMKVSCSRMTKTWLNIQFDSRIMCIHVMAEANLLVFGTLSHYVCAYHLSNCELAWQVTLNDAVLCICSQVDRGKWSLYAALADGTLAVVECPVLTNAVDHGRFEQDIFYILIGSGSITCLALIERRLWCACGNRIVILHAKTLDTIDQFTVSTNPLDVVSSITESKYGIWVLLSGLTIFQLWDPQNLVCRMLFDTKDNKCSRLAQESPFGAVSRVTTLLSFGESLWVGTADGYLLIYDIHLLPSCKASAFNSPSRNGPIDVTSMELVTEKIQELFLRQADPSFRNPAMPEFDRTSGDQRGRSDSGYQTVGDGSKDCSGAPEGSRPQLWTGREAGSAPCLLESVSGGNDSSDADDSSRAVSSAATSTMRGSSIASAETSPMCRYEKLLNRRSTLPYTPVASEICHGTGRDCLSFCHDSFCQDGAQSEQCCSGCQRSPAVEGANGHDPDSEPLQNLSAKKRCRRRSESALDVVTGRAGWLRMACRSFDDITHLLAGSGESLGSFAKCDSFEFDDVFVTHTEDELWWSRKVSLTSNSSASIRGSRRLSLPHAKLIPPVRTSLDRNGHCSSNRTKKRGQDPLIILLEPCRTNSSSSIEPPQTDKEGSGQLAIGPFSRLNRISTSPKQRSSSVSSLDDLSSPASHVEYDSVQDCRSHAAQASKTGPLANCKESDSGSFVSFAESEVPYNVELAVREKRKISSKSLRCLIAIQCNADSPIFSCSGSCGDPDAILKWTLSKQKESKVEMWECAPVGKACVRPSLERKHGLYQPLDQPTPPPSTCSDFGQLSSSAFVHATSNLVGNSLAKVHDIITNLGSDIPIS